VHVCAWGLRIHDCTCSGTWVRSRMHMSVCEKVCAHMHIHKCTCMHTYMFLHINKFTFCTYERRFTGRCESGPRRCQSPSACRSVPITPSAYRYVKLRQLGLHIETPNVSKCDNSRRRPGDSVSQDDSESLTRQKHALFTSSVHAVCNDGTFVCVKLGRSCQIFVDENWSKAFV
jgi:hypothetical protein